MLGFALVVGALCGGFEAPAELAVKDTQPRPPQRFDRVTERGWYRYPNRPGHGKGKPAERRRKRRHKP